MRSPFTAGTDFRIPISALDARYGGFFYPKAAPYNAVGDGVADDTAAVAAVAAAAAAAGGFVSTGAYGTFKTTTAVTAFTGRFQGNAQLVDSDGNKRGRYFSAVTSQPSVPTLADGTRQGFYYGAVGYAFNGDLSRNQFAIEHRVTGADTLGTLAQTAGITVNGVNALNSATINVNSNPSTAGFASSGAAYLSGVSFTYTGLTASSFTGCSSHAATTGGEIIRSTSAGYLMIPEASPFIGYLDNSSGRSGAASGGRTGLGFFHLKLTQNPTAGGDIAGLWIDGKAYGVSAGSATTASSTQTWSSPGSTSLAVASTTGYPTSGTFYVVRTGTGLAAVTYTGISGNSFTGCSNYGAVTSGDTVSGRWDQNSSVGMWAGSMNAGADGVYIDVDEIQMADGGHDATGIGIIRNFYRSNDTGALATAWNGLRFQNLGLKNVDVGIMLWGQDAGYKVGIDLSAAHLSQPNTTASGVNALNSATINTATNPITQGFSTGGGIALLSGVAFTYTGITSSSFTGCGNHAATTGGEAIAGRYQAAAITLAQNQKIFFNASGTDSDATDPHQAFGFYRKPDSTGSDYIYGHNFSGTNQIVTVVGGNSTFQVTATAANINGNSTIAGTLNMSSNPVTGVSYLDLSASTTTTGTIRLANGGTIYARNAANSADKKLIGFGSDDLISVFQNMNMTDGLTIAVGTTTGTKIGTGSTQKLGFFGLTPIVQPPTSTAAAARVGGGGTTVTTTDTYDGWTLPSAIRALRLLGILA